MPVTCRIPLEQLGRGAAHIEGELLRAGFAFTTQPNQHTIISVPIALRALVGNVRAQQDGEGVTFVQD